MTDELRDQMAREIARAIYKRDDPSWCLLEICQPYADAAMAVVGAALHAYRAEAQEQRRRATEAMAERDKYRDVHIEQQHTIVGLREELSEAMAEAEQLRGELAKTRERCKSACDEWQRVWYRDNQRAERAETLLRDLVDSEDCWFDHHGGCQAHGYLRLQPAEKCPQAEAKELLAALNPAGGSEPDESADA